MPTVILLAAIILGLVVFYLRNYFVHIINRHRGKLPPGPLALPIIGTLGEDPDAPWETWTKWSHQYGPIFTFFLGPQLQLVISDAELCRTVLKDTRFEGRPVTNLSRIFKNHALAFTEGTRWKDTRRFEITALKDFGRVYMDKVFSHLATGSNLLEEYIQDTVRDVIKDIFTTNSQPFYPKDHMQRCVANSIASILCGHSLKSDDPRFNRITENVAVILGNTTTPTNILNVFPFLTLIPPFSHRQKLVEERMAETFGFIKHEVNEHKKSFDAENVRDFIDAYLKEQMRPDVNKESFTDDQLVYMGVEMYAAGLDGTLAALQWWSLLIASHPDVQQKCQDEIDDNLGRERIVSWTDRANLPYCEAIMNEVLRIAVVDPSGLPHRCLEDTELQGYIIPKDTTVIMNYYGIHFSPASFSKPWKFRPERFLDENGKFAQNPNSFPFATGRRMCSGDNFAKMIIFISTVSIMQRFTFSRVDDIPWTSVKRINAVGIHPDRFFISATPR